MKTIKYIDTNGKEISKEEYERLCQTGYYSGTSETNLETQIETYRMKALKFVDTNGKEISREEYERLCQTGHFTGNNKMNLETRIETYRLKEIPEEEFIKHPYELSLTKKITMFFNTDILTDENLKKRYEINIKTIPFNIKAWVDGNDKEGQDFVYSNYVLTTDNSLDYILQRNVSKEGFVKYEISLNSNIRIIGECKYNESRDELERALTKDKEDTIKEIDLLNLNDNKYYLVYSIEYKCIMSFENKEKSQESWHKHYNRKPNHRTLSDLGIDMFKKSWHGDELKDMYIKFNIKDIKIDFEKKNYLKVLGEIIKHSELKTVFDLFCNSIYQEDYKIELLLLIMGFEVLFKTSQDNEAIAYKIRRNTAVFLKGIYDNPNYIISADSIYEFIGDMYKVRSTLVHTGKVKEGIDINSNIERLREYLRIAIIKYYNEVICKSIKHDDFIKELNRKGYD